MTTESTFPGARRSVTVSVEVLSVEHGGWCDACALPSAVTVWFTTTTGRQSTLRSRTACEGEHS